MGREIRVTIDDDEVFERMKARKRELDLSWEEVLHRGLRRDETRQSDAQHDREQYDRRRRRGPPPDPLSNPGQFAEDLKRQIRGQVVESVQSSLEHERQEGPLESEVTSLEAAEDAVMVFDFLEERDQSTQVPLRVTLEASTGGLAIDVVAVRQGKTVASTNAFDPEVRRRVVEGLAGGDTATLRIEAGDEEYSVSPVLSWSRTNGVPSVTEVTIEEVHFDVE
jgi:hypothetical protein